MVLMELYKKLNQNLHIISKLNIKFLRRLKYTYRDFKEKPWYMGRVVIILFDFCWFP